MNNELHYSDAAAVHPRLKYGTNHNPNYTYNYCNLNYLTANAHLMNSEKQREKGKIRLVRVKLSGGDLDPEEWLFSSTEPISQEATTGPCQPEIPHNNGSSKPAPQETGTLATTSHGKPLVN